MLYSKDEVINKIHLIISVVIVIPAALLYGFYPDALIDLQPETIDEFSFFKAVMGLYIACACLWCFGIFKQPYWKIAMLSNIVFMLGLGLGRLVSILLDGTPSAVYTIGMFAELFLAIYGITVLRRHDRTTDTETYNNR